jgi:hypothetical protein
MSFDLVNFKSVQGEKNAVENHEKRQKTGEQTDDRNHDQRFFFQKNIVRKVKS